MIRLVKEIGDLNLCFNREYFAKMESAETTMIKFMILQTLQQSHSQELQKITETLAKITQLPVEAIKPHLDAMLEQLVKNKELPFYQKVSDEEWIQALNEWSSSHNPNIPLLSDYAVSRAGIYEDGEI